MTRLHALVILLDLTEDEWDDLYTAYWTLSDADLRAFVFEVLARKPETLLDALAAAEFDTGWAAPVCPSCRRSCDDRKANTIYAGDVWHRLCFDLHHQAAS